MAPTVRALMICWRIVAIRTALLQQLKFAALDSVKEDKGLGEFAVGLERHMAHDAVEIVLGDGARNGLTIKRRSSRLYAVDDDLGLHIAVSRIRTGILLEGGLIGLGELLEPRRRVVGRRLERHDGSFGILRPCALDEI